MASVSSFEKRREETRKDFSQLPIELFLTILAHCTVLEWYTYRQVSKSWNAACTLAMQLLPCTIRASLFPDKTFKPEKLRLLLEKCAHRVEHLSFLDWDCWPPAHLVATLATFRYSRLTRLSLRYWPNGNIGSTLLQNCPLLKHFTVEYFVDEPNEDLFVIRSTIFESVHLPMRNLPYECNDAVTNFLFDCCQELKQLSIYIFFENEAQLKMFNYYCGRVASKLQSLHLDICYGFREPPVILEQSHIWSFKNLTALHLYGRMLNDNILERIASSFQNLKSFQWTDGAWDVINSGVEALRRLPHLETFRPGCWRDIDEASAVATIAQKGHLQVFTYSETKIDFSVMLELIEWCPKIRLIKVSTINSFPKSLALVELCKKKLPPRCRLHITNQQQDNMALAEYNKVMMAMKQLHQLGQDRVNQVHTVYRNKK